MRDFRVYRRLFLAANLLLISVTAHADLYDAAKAFEQKDFARAFELYRELAELGQPEAQENLAVMYVSGEGVQRDNILGYAWAKIVLEQGPRAAAQGIVDQLEPHVTETAREKVAALQAQFGKEALQKSLLPIEYPPEYKSPPPKCHMRSPVNPDDYYPRGAIDNSISGNVLVDVKIWGDGRAHDPHVEYSLPDQVFEASGRAVGLYTGYAAHVENGVAVPCTIRFKVKFFMRGRRAADVFQDNFDAIRQRAEAGDSRSQLLYAHALDSRPDLNASADKSIRWFLKAGQAGIPAAQFKIANGLMWGYGVQKDEAKAMIWLDKAANGGNADAQVELANYYLRGAPDSAAAAKAAALLERATAGSLEARFYFSAMQASHPDAALRNPQRALDNANEWLAAFDDNPIAYEIRAAAQAHLGDFAAAAKSQAKAVGMANKLGWNSAPQKERLAGYQARKPWTGDLFAFY